MQPQTLDVAGAIRKIELDTRRAKSGNTFDLLVLTLSNGEKVEINAFSPMDKGYFSLIKMLAKPKQ